MRRSHTRRCPFHAGVEGMKWPGLHRGRADIRWSRSQGCPVDKAIHTRRSSRQDVSAYAGCPRKSSARSGPAHRAVRSTWRYRALGDPIHVVGRHTKRHITREGPLNAEVQHIAVQPPRRSVARVGLAPEAIKLTKGPARRSRYTWRSSTSRFYVHEVVHTWRFRACGHLVREAVRRSGTRGGSIHAGSRGKSGPTYGAISGTSWGWSGAGL